MARDDDAQKRARARRLRLQIDQLTGITKPRRKTGPPSRGDGESPQAFVERRMREIAAQEQSKVAKPRKAAKKKGKRPKRGKA